MLTRSLLLEVESPLAGEEEQEQDHIYLCAKLKWREKDFQVFSLLRICIKTRVRWCLMFCTLTLIMHSLSLSLSSLFLCTFFFILSLVIILDCSCTSSSESGLSTCGTCRIERWHSNSSFSAAIPTFSVLPRSTLHVYDQSIGGSSDFSSH